MAAVIRDRNSGLGSLERFEVIQGQIVQRRKMIRERKRIETILRVVIEFGFILILLLSAYSLGFTNASAKQTMSPRSANASSLYAPPSSSSVSH
jgi:hypothetical protein